MTFYGNPNAKVTAIDTSGGIAYSRTSGQTPCFIQVSASAITCTGTVIDTAGNNLAGHVVAPYEDLEYIWDFGDAAGAETFTDPATGATVNANSAQMGPEGAYCYRSAGTYTITLTIRGKNGSGFTTATVTRDITVTTFNPSAGTWYFDSVSGNDSNDGLTEGTPKQSISAINTKAVRNTQIWIKGNSSWDGADGIDISRSGFGNGPLRIGKYGTGANPKVRVTSGTNRCLLMNANGSGTTTFVDIVISDIDFERGGSKTLEIVHFLISNSNATISDIYLDRCNMVSDNSSGTGGIWATFQSSTGGLLESNFGIWGGSITATATDTAQNVGFFRGARNWNFFVGIDEINGAGGDGTRDHHMYPDFQNHGLFRWINFGNGPTRNYCINTNWDTISGSLELAQYFLIAGCNMTGTNFSHDGSDALGNAAKVRFPSFVVQGNAIHDLNSGGALFFNITSLTSRDNRYWNVPNFVINPGNNLADLIMTRSYRNYIYRSSNPNDENDFEFSQVAFTLPQQITDNITHDTLGASKCLGVQAASWQAANSLIDRNQYWIPNDADSKGWFDDATAKTFVQWNAFGFDLSGSVADPMFLDPANGDFTQFRRRVRLTAAA